MDERQYLGSVDVGRASSALRSAGGQRRGAGCPPLSDNRRSVGVLPRRHSRYLSAALAQYALLVGAALAPTGCDITAKPDPQADLRRLEEEIATRDRQLTEQKNTIDELQRQLATARGITDEDLRLVYYPEKLQIDALTAGADFDGKPGDDGVIVYFKPLDRVGDVVKVAGDVRIQVFDLAASSVENLVAECALTAPELSKLWYGKLLTQHFTVKCPWKGAPPRNRELTVRVVFVDFLTKRALTAQNVCTTNAPEPESPPATMR